MISRSIVISFQVLFVHLYNYSLQACSSVNLHFCIISTQSALSLFFVSFPLSRMLNSEESEVLCLDGFFADVKRYGLISNLLSVVIGP